jgi:hypothetical protein
MQYYHKPPPLRNGSHGPRSSTFGGLGDDAAV